MAGTGPMPIVSGATPATAQPTSRTSGLAARALGRPPRVVTTQTAAPSFWPLALPAVTVASGSIAAHAPAAARRGPRWCVSRAGVLVPVTTAAGALRVAAPSPARSPRRSGPRRWAATARRCELQRRARPARRGRSRSRGAGSPPSRACRRAPGGRRRRRSPGPRASRSCSVDAVAARAPAQPSRVVLDLAHALRAAGDDDRRRRRSAPASRRRGPPAARSRSGGRSAAPGTVTAARRRGRRPGRSPAASPLG